MGDRAREGRAFCGLGNAYAGQAASAQDASTIFFNPAGMALLQGAQASIGVDVIIPKASLPDPASDSA